MTAATRRWLWITAPAPVSPRSANSHGSGIVPEWAANLLQSAYVREASRAGLPPLRGYSLTLRLPDGSRVRDDGNTATGDRRITGTVSDVRIRAAFQAASRKAHTTVTRIRLLHPDNHAAVAATLVASSSAQFGRRLPPLSADPAPWRHIDGYLIVVRDSCGKTVAAAASAGNEGSSWVDPAWAWPDPLARPVRFGSCPPHIKTPLSC